MNLPQFIFFYVARTLLAQANVSLRRAGIGKHQHKAENAMYKQQLDNFQNAQYYGDMTIGEQKIKGIFDTGSFELLVLSSRCTSCRRHPYNYTMSKTYVNNGTLAQHVFGSGPVISMQAYEHVQVGPMEANKQVFWEIVEHDIQVLEFAKFSAIVGIGHGFAPTSREKTLVMNYDVKEFSVCLENKDMAPGWLFWGPSMTQEKRKELMVNVPVVGENHWGVKMSDVTIGDKKLLCEGGGCGAIVDSGTSLIAAPGSHLEALTPLLDKIKEDCSNLHELPMLYLTMGDHTFALPPKAYVMRITGAVLEADNVWDVLFFKPKIKKIDICLPGFMQLDKISDYGPVWILGMPFLRYYYTTFDRTNKQLHFARASKTCDPLKYEPVEKKSTKKENTKKDALLEVDEEKSEQKSARDLFREIDDDLDTPMTVDLKSLLPPLWDIDRDAFIQ